MQVLALGKAMNKTVRDFGLGATTAAGLWGATTLSTLDRVPHEVRSPSWPRIRNNYLRNHPVCEACGQKDNLNVHHIIPFRIDPSKELDESNLITLCTDGPGHMNCHLVLGHAGNYKGHNERVREDAERIQAMLKSIKFK